MTIVGRLLQGEGHTGAQPLRRLAGHAHFHGHGVGRAKADASDIAGEPIRILGHHLNGVMAIGLEDAHRARRSNAMGMQKHHDVANGLLLGPAGGDFSRAEFSDPRHVPQLLGGRFDDFESSRPERVDDSLRQLGTDAANHSRAEIFLDALGGGRRGGFEKVGFELQPVGAIGRPNADGVYELSRRYRGGMPDDRDEVTFTARLHLQDGEAIFLIVKSHPFDRADERFTRSGRVGCRPQDASWLPREFPGRL